VGAEPGTSGKTIVFMFGLTIGIFTSAYSGDPWLGEGMVRSDQQGRP